jgi:O-antigen/teichoic acid export membrane protein
LPIRLSFNQSFSMGVIQKQTIKGSAWSYIGAFLGFIFVGILCPKILASNQVGLLNVLVAISALFSQFSSLGMNSVTARMFPYFKINNDQKFGYLTFLLVITMIGFVASMMIGIYFKDWIIASRSGDSELLEKYAYYLIPMTFFTIFFNLFDVYNKMLNDITSGIFLKEFLLRLLNLISILLYYFKIISFDIFVLSYVGSYFIPLVGIFIILLIRGEFFIQFRSFRLTKEMKKEIFLVAAFGILAGFSGIIYDYLDKFLVNKYMGLSNTGVYTTAVYIAAMILLPSRALNKISSTSIAECWKENDINTIDNIYKKSSINQLIFGFYLFILIITNRHNIFRFLPFEYANGQWVLIITGITNLVIMFSGVSYSILSTAKYYWWMSFLMITNVILIIVTYILLIPLWGMVGASIACLISSTIIRLGSLVVIGIKSSIWPFTAKHLTALLISIITGIIVFLIPKLTNIYLDGFVRMVILSILFAAGILGLKVSEELNTIYFKVKRRFFPR